MNFYFMLRAPGLRGFVDLANFPPADMPAYEPGDEIAHVLWSDGTVWHCRDMDNVPPDTVVRVTEGNLPVDCPAPEDAGIFLCMMQHRLPRTLDALPIPNQPRTIPAWRATIGLASERTSVSYVGEYPGQMTKIPKGSLLSFSPFLQTGDGLETTLLLVNLRDKPGREAGSVLFADPVTRRVLARSPVRQNQINVISMTDLPAERSGVCVSYSKDIAGIPLYLCHDANRAQMSLEHTHPPQEMAVFGNRLRLQRNLKTWWYDNLRNGDA